MKFDKSFDRKMVANLFRTDICKSNLLNACSH